MDLQTLTENFAIFGVLSFNESEAGLLRARITTPACTAELYLQGAHLTAWQPAGHGPVLFLSEQSNFLACTAIRGGIPIIFPWFGPRSGSIDNPRTDGPSHGFARLEPWSVAFAALSGDVLHLTLTLSPTQSSRELGFDHFQVALELIFGEILIMRLTVLNEANDPLRFEEAFHTYFTVGDAAQIRLTGLGASEYLDKTDQLLPKVQSEAVLTLSSETDRLYVNTTSEVAIEDPTLRRRITVTKQGSNTTVIWNPWAEVSARLVDMADEGWRRMTCIETANAGENAIALAPRSAHTMEARISVAPL